MPLARGDDDQTRSSQTDHPLTEYIPTNSWVDLTHASHGSLPLPSCTLPHIRMPALTVPLVRWRELAGSNQGDLTSSWVFLGLAAADDALFPRSG